MNRKVLWCTVLVLLSCSTMTPSVGSSSYVADTMQLCFDRAHEVYPVADHQANLIAYDGENVVLSADMDENAQQRAKYVARCLNAGS